MQKVFRNLETNAKKKRLQDEMGEFAGDPSYGPKIHYYVIHSFGA
jgi:hypothetical protein